jgi:hypothetical protein
VDAFVGAAEHDVAEQGICRCEDSAGEKHPKIEANLYCATNYRHLFIVPDLTAKIEFYLNEK